MDACLNEYEFDIKIIKVNENKVDNALNRRVHETCATTISIYNIILANRILEVVALD